MIDHMRIRGARVHNLKNVDIDIPLHQIVGISGVSGSGKSSLALGVLYAEGSRRYLESLATYTRRRMAQSAKADVDEICYIPAALALHQRPGVPGIRSTFGTGTELLNHLRLIFSRLASHTCPHGHVLEPSLDVASGKSLVCPVCEAVFDPPSAEELAFNSQGACPTCEGTGVVWTVDESTLVPDERLSIDEGAVASWNALMWSLMKDVAREMGVRTDIPFASLTPAEKEIVYHGPAQKKHIFYHNQRSGQTSELDFTYYNAVYTVENALAKVKDEKGMKRLEKFLKKDICPDCHGSRLNQRARQPVVHGLHLDEACALPLDELVAWVKEIPDTLPEPMRPMAHTLKEAFLVLAERLLALGLGYLSLDRPTSTLSTGERQRMALARAVRHRTTGVLYVLDEPSIGLHPSNLKGLVQVMRDLVADGNSVVFVDHDPQVLREADWLIEMGPGAGVNGGQVIAQGRPGELIQQPASLIAPFLHSAPKLKPSYSNPFEIGQIKLQIAAIHTVKPLCVHFPKGKLTVVTGVSGSGKTTLVLESLIPGLEALIHHQKLPDHVLGLEADGIHQVKLIDATPIGVNIRSTVATYANIHDDLRRVMARTAQARAAGLKAGDFSYNTGKLRCPVCDGTGSISLDIQFLPDVEITCPDCHGSRYASQAEAIHYENRKGESYTLPQMMQMDVQTALAALGDLKTVHARLQVLQDLGLGYLTLGEQTPGLSGGEAQRLKLASEMGKGQQDTVFVFDEPTIGLHPLDVQVLLQVFDHLIDLGATVIVIEHDLDVMAHADYMIDLGPGGGHLGGQIVAAGTPLEIKQNSLSKTGKFL